MGVDVHCRWSACASGQDGRAHSFRAGLRTEHGMDKLSETVFLVDDDPRVLRAMARLLTSEGWSTRTYRSAPEFLADHDETAPGCLVLDLLMPEMTGLDLQRE